MRRDADLSLRAQAALVVEFLERLRLGDATLAGIDTGSGLAQLVVQERPDLVGRLVTARIDHAGPYALRGVVVGG